MIVVDSSFLVAYHNSRDSHHAAAVSVMTDFVRGRWGQGLLLEYVFLEVVTVLRARRGHATAAAVGTVVLDARELDFVPCSEVFAEAWEMFNDQNRPRGGPSFADCAIAVVALREAAGRVATFDRDFEAISGISVVS